MSIGIKITATDTATPILADLRRELTDRTQLNKYIGASAEAGTRMYLRKIAQDKHTTAKKLGATPTGYLTKRAELVEGSGNRDRAKIIVTGAIFKRVFGPVTVTARKKKMLTIPWRAEAYGKRAGEFGKELFVYRSRQGRAFLARNVGGILQLLYLLKRSVVLPQDRSLLPSDEQFSQMAELAARGYLRKEARALGIQLPL